MPCTFLTKPKKHFTPRGNGTAVELFFHQKRLNIGSMEKKYFPSNHGQRIGTKEEILGNGTMLLIMENSNQDLLAFKIMEVIYLLGILKSKDFNFINYEKKRFFKNFFGGCHYGFPS